MAATACPCGSSQKIADCCGPFLSGDRLPETAEQLMRSRYTAYTLVDIGYLRKTLAPESRTDFDAATTKTWAEQSLWKGLTILSTKFGTASDRKGTVEFVAKFEQNGQVVEHHEVSQFRKSDKGQWFFVDGEAHTHKEGEGHHHHHPKQTTVTRDAPKVGRNDPCTCGSGKKYKKCCGVNAEA